MMELYKSFGLDMCIASMRAWFQGQSPCYGGFFQLKLKLEVLSRLQNCHPGLRSETDVDTQLKRNWL